MYAIPLFPGLLVRWSEECEFSPNSEKLMRFVVKATEAASTGWLGTA